MQPIFQDEAKAREWLEARIWPNGPICPHCGNTNSDRIRRLEGQKHRPGAYQCNECREQFTVTVGTVFERSHVPLTKWLAMLFLMVSSKKGVSAHQIHRMLGLSYKTAWFAMHRLREAMKEDSPGPLGGQGKTVEADETYWGNKARSRYTYTLTPDGWKRSGVGNADQMKVAALVERHGRVRAVHVSNLTANAIRDILVRTADRKSALMTDESNIYTKTGTEYASHDTVNHTKGEYVRYEHGKMITTNTIEGYFSIFKRGMKGIYQHCSEKHLHRYLAEFDYRYNTRIALGCDDAQRADKLATAIVGKRLTYRRPCEQQTS